MQNLSLYLPRCLALAVAACVLVLAGCRDSDVRPGNTSDLVLDERDPAAVQERAEQNPALPDELGPQAVTEADIMPAEFTRAGARQPDRIAFVTLQPTAGNIASGMVAFIHADANLETVRVVGKIVGLAPGEHGMHVHEIGNCTGPDASTAGEHYDPAGGMVHGAREAELRHLGDLGNIVADANQEAHFDFTDTRIGLVGAGSIAQKALIVHAGADDLRTQPGGDAGARIACGVIMEQQNILVP